MLRTLIFIFFFTSFCLKAQLTTNNKSPTDLVQNILVGKGVTVSNVTYTGNLSAIGGFNGSQSNIGFSEGIILSTGSVFNAIGPNNNSGATTDYKDVPDAETAGDVDLDNLSTNNTVDAIVLEFDFIPQGDTVEFQYIFASEEYEYFEFSVYNDVFAFFISGPGISGGVQNLAVVPGTSSPITISNINKSTNSSLYNFNGNGVSGPQFTDPKVVQFNGFTVPLTAISKVTPCKTYHLKIAIADVFDGNFDSGVFLKGGSL